MLVVRDIHLIKKDDRLYVNNSSPNKLFEKLIAQIGKITLLAWVKEAPIENISSLVPLLPSPDLTVVEIPVKLGLKEKIQIIKNAVKQAKALSLKFCFFDSFLACHYSRKYNKPFVIESGAYAFASLWHHGGSIKYKLAALPINWLAKFYHAKAKYIIYVSKHYLQQRYPSDANQVGCSDAILDDVSDDVLERRIARIETEKKYTLGLIGDTNVGYRGHDTLIKVMAELRNIGYDVHVRFAGNPSGESERRNYAKTLNVEEFICFDGLLSQDEVLQWIDDIDILVMPTLAETLGRGVIEAMSRGCPVIGSEETALPEQIGCDSITGARNVGGIVQIIEHMLNDKEYMKLCAKENFWRAKKYNSDITDRVRKSFYSNFYKENGIHNNN